MPASLFATSGIRGPAETTFTNQFCFDIGRAFSLFLSQQGLEGSVAIGMDPRNSSPRIKNYVSNGLEFSGRQVLDQGATPVPAMCLATQNPSVAGSLMVTGSHISKDLNGVKFFLKGQEIEPYHQDLFEAIYHQIKTNQPVRELYQEKINDFASQNYVQALENAAIKQHKLKIVVDCANGAQSHVMPQLLLNLGHKVVKTNCNIQQDFIARDTEVDGVLDSLIAQVKSNRADLGIAYDSDGDRVVFVDETYRPIPGDYSCALIARDSPTESIVVSISVSRVVDFLGKRVYRTPVGSPHIVSKMKETGSLLGFEASGGCAHKEMTLTRDGGLTTIKFLNLLTQTGLTASQLYDSLPRFYQSRTKYPLDPQQALSLLTHAQTFFTPTHVDQTDGLKLFFSPETYILIRPSRTAPELRIFIESSTFRELENIVRMSQEFLDQHHISNTP